MKLLSLLSLLFLFPGYCYCQDFEKGNLLFQETFADNRNGWSATTYSNSTPYTAYVTNANYYYCDLPNNSWGFTWVPLASQINSLLQNNKNVQLSIDFSINQGNANNYFSFGLMFGLHNVTNQCPGGDFYLLQVAGNLVTNQAWGGVAERVNCDWYNRSSGNGQIINLNALQNNRLIINKDDNSYTAYLNGIETISFNYKGALGSALKLYFEAGKYKFQNVQVNELKKPALPPGIDKTSINYANQAPPSPRPDAGFSEVSEHRMMVGKNYALLIGTSEYDDSRYARLINASIDIDKLYTTLVELYNFDAGNIIRLKNETKSKFEATIDDLVNTLTEEDNLLIFYAGHNSYNATTGKGYWLFRDSNKDRLSSLLSNESLKEYISNLKARHVLLISDACFGVTLRLDLLDNVPRDIKQLYTKKSRTYMSSSSFTPAPDKSIFLEYLIKELKNNNKKFIAAGDLFNLFKNNVINNSEVDQIPIYGVMRVTGDESGDYVFIKK